MTTRRHFIEGAVVAGIATAGVTSVARALGFEAETSFRLRLERVVFDERFAAAHGFADQARRRSVRISPIGESVHDLWYDDLYYRWRDAKAPTAGITDHRALFLLEMMAGDAGMRVVHRVHHHESGGVLVHRPFGPLALRDGLSSQLSRAGADWARRAADIVTAWPSDATSTAPSLSNVLDAKSQPLDAHTLISWVIC